MFFFPLVLCSTDYFFSHLFVWLFLRHWFLNGNYLIIIVSAFIILPLALMKQLGMLFILSSHFLFMRISLTHADVTWSTPVFFFFGTFTVSLCTEIKVSSLLNLFLIVAFILHCPVISAMQVTWATQVASPSPAWCFSSFRWVSKDTQNATNSSVVKYLSLINQMGATSQVIYKKFNTECPLSDIADLHHTNETHFDHHHTVNATGDECEAKFFTINSQVRGKLRSHCLPLASYFFVCTVDLLPCVLRKSVSMGVLAIKQHNKTFVCLSDCIHHPNPGLCFCLPPWGAANLHWATRVSQEVQKCFLIVLLEVERKLMWFLVWFYPQSQQEAYAARRQHLHLGHVWHVPADCSFWLPHLLR